MFIFTIYLCTWHFNTPCIHVGTEWNTNICISSNNVRHLFLRDILTALYSNVFLVLYHNNFTDLCIYLETYQKYEYAKSLHGQITIGKYWIKYELMQNIWLWCFSNPHLLHYSHVEWNGNRSTFVSIYIITLYCILHEGKSFCMRL